MKKHHFVVDENMPLVEACFGSLGTISKLPGRQMQTSDLQGADALFVRSVTNVNADLLQGTTVEFVGTATIGTDHLDSQWLKQQGIHHVSAPGCNADSVAEYIVACLAHLKLRKGLQLDQVIAGVVGAGNVGTRVASRLRALGLPHLQFDPLRHDDDDDLFMSSNLEDLHRCNVVCCHAPLTTTGAHPSHHMIDENFLSKLQDGTVLISAGRGPVIDFKALKHHLSRLTVCLDVWEPEPNIPLDVMHAVEICTPHVAGYSMQSKWRGTLMLHKAFCEHAKLPHQKVPWPMEAPEHTFNGATWEELVLSIYDPREDSSRTRLALQDSQDVGVSFDQLRKSYPLRHEFAFPNIKASSMDTQHQERAERLGFRFC